MTNKDKYLKDGVDIKELLLAFTEFCDKYNVGIIEVKGFNNGVILNSFFQSEIKPILTEDERVILRTVKDYKTIVRNIEGNIQVENGDGSFACLCAYNHLFQFIKIGEEYTIEEFLNND